MNLKTGDRIGDYEILGVLGAGGMGSVFKVRNVISDRVEALKVLLPNLAEHQDLKDRFLREIKTSASLEHTNIAGLRTAFQSGDMLLMVMEFVEGQTLDQRMKGGPLPIDEAVRYTAQVLDALEYAHSRGVVHRDIKPQNVMITPRGTAKLLDFGIAKASSDKQLTMTGTTLGSLYYMSPEQIRGEHVDARADLYSLGITLYELVTGKRPFGGDSGFAIMAEHLQKQPVPPVELDSRVPPALNSVILRSLAKSAADRYQDAAEFRAALRNVAFGPTTTQASVDEATQPLGAGRAPSPAPPSPAPPAFANAPGSPQAQAPPQAPPAFVPPPPSHPPAQAFAPFAPEASAEPDWQGSQTSSGMRRRSKPRRNTLALGLIAAIIVIMIAAVGAVIAGSYYFGGQSTVAAGKEPGFLDRITGMFGKKEPPPSQGAETEAAPAGEAGAAPAHVDPASIAQASQTLPAASIDTGESPVKGTVIGGVSSSNVAGVTPGTPRTIASEGTRSRNESGTRDIGAAAAALVSQAAPPKAGGASTARESIGGGYSATPPTPKVDPRALEQSRDALAKLGIRAGTIEESARTLIEEQAKMGVSLRADIRASLKRMEYLMDRAEAAIGRQDLDDAKTQMDAAEREIEKLEKFFRI
ncbi:MAG: serine/threonine protein kinase [Bryobacterales bacterium]|nr:serine/threonine protein kinase [Bryobacterales bacterium]